MDIQETGVLAIEELEEQHGPLDKLFCQASKYKEALETDVDVQWMLTGKPMFEEQLEWLAEIGKALHVARQACALRGTSKMDTTRKTRLRNQEATPSEIFKLLVGQLQLNIEDGDERCKAVKRKAIEALPHAIGQLAAAGYPIYFNQSVTSYEGLHRETYKQLDRISSMGDPITQTISTFKRALEYFVVVYCKAYTVAVEADRDALFKEAHLNLVASYPLYMEREYKPLAAQEPIII